MKYAILLLFLTLLFSSCEERRVLHVHFDDPDAFYLDESSVPDLEIEKEVYVPAYSNLYYESDVRKTYFTVILSLRNISFTDSIYFTRIEYYDTEGVLLKEHIDKVLVLRPMESVEFIVESTDKKGGPGANFVVSYGGKANLSNAPYIESVMLGDIDGYGFSFRSPSVEIKKPGQER
jgi:hypothetical protein